jgi:hypothetical protein
MIKLKLLYERLLKEVGDFENIKTYPYSNDSFVTEQGWRVNVIFQEYNNQDLEDLNINTQFYPGPIYAIGFEVEGVQSQFNKTSLNEYLKILKTVTQICSDFLKKNDPNGLTFFAANKDDSKFLVSDPQKSKLYKLIVTQQLLKNNKYKIVNLNLLSGFKGFMIYKK